MRIVTRWKQLFILSNCSNSTNRTISWTDYFLSASGDIYCSKILYIKYCKLYWKSEISKNLMQCLSFLFKINITCYEILNLQKKNILSNLQITKPFFPTPKNITCWKQLFILSNCVNSTNENHIYKDKFIFCLLLGKPTTWKYCPRKKEIGVNFKPLVRLVFLYFHS